MSAPFIEALKQQIDALLTEYPELQEDEVLRADMLEGETELASIMKWLLNQEREAASMTDAIKLRSKEIGERKARYERRSEAMRKLMQSVLDRADLRKIELPEATISLRSVPRSLVIEDENLLPLEYGSNVWKPDRKAIKAALDEGKEVRGATLSNGGETISIRVK